MYFSKISLVLTPTTPIFIFAKHLISFIFSKNALTPLGELNKIALYFSKSFKSIFKFSISIKGSLTGIPPLLEIFSDISTACFLSLVTNIFLARFSVSNHLKVSLKLTTSPIIVIAGGVILFFSTSSKIFSKFPTVTL